MVDRRGSGTGLVACLMLVGTITIGGCHREEAMTDATTHPVDSPSGLYRLRVIDTKDEGGYPAQTFEVQDSDGRPIFNADARWSTRHRLVFAWDASDRVWVYSGDVGTDVWERAGGTWRKRAYVRGGELQPPDVIRRLAPSIFG